MENYERARRKSRNVARVEYKQEVFRIDVDKLKKLIAVSALTLTVLVSSLTGLAVKGVNDLQETVKVNDYLSQYSHIVSENTHRTNDGQHYWYDTYDIEKEVSNDPETFKEELYAVYNRIGYNDENKIDHMNKIVNHTGNYSDFNDYLVQNGFVDENGEPSRENYEEYMDAYILAKVNMEEVESRKK